MHFLIYGEDTYRSRQAVRRASDRFSATRDAVGLNVRTFVRGRESVESLREELFASPFLADRKLVLAEGYLEAPDADQALLVEALAVLPESTVAIFFETASAEDLKDAPLFADLAAQKFSAEHGLLSPRDAAKGAVADATALGVSLLPKAAEALVARIGTDGWSLASALGRLVAAVQAEGRAEITDADVVAAIPAVTLDDDNTLFPLIDAVCAGDAREIVLRLQAAHEAGVHPLQAVAALAKQLRHALISSDMAGAPAGDVAKALGVHPFVAQKAVGLARRGKSQLLLAFDRVVRLDAELKSSGADELDVAQVFLELSAKA
jgi:DNA polymerase-3 subunit delta